MKSKVTAILSALVIFSLLFSTGCGKKEGTDTDPTATAADAIVQDDLTGNADTPAPEGDTNQGTTALSEESTSDVSQEDTSTTIATTAASVETPKTTEEIVTFFNQSANKIKTDATKVVKNYEKRKLNEEHFVVPESLEKTGRDMISSFMKDDNDPIVYSTKEDIKNEYIVPDQSYVSRLDPAYVKSATCTDKGSTYEIVIKLKDQQNPTAGVGIGAVCDVIEAGEVAEGASFVKKFTTSYYNCEIRATIDKATGKMTHTNYKTPVILALTVSMFGTHDIQTGFTFEKDYTITY